MKSQCILEVILNYINHPVAWGQEMTRVPELACHLVAAINIHLRPVHYNLHSHIHHTTMFYFNSINFSISTLPKAMVSSDNTQPGDVTM